MMNPNLRSPRDLIPGGMARLALCAALLIPARAALAEDYNDIQVDVVVDLTEAGQKVERPSPGHPAFFLPVLKGYTEGGAVMSQEKPPPEPVMVAKLAAKALAQQGYFMASKKTPPPSLILMFWWGYKAPIVIGASSDLAGGGPIGGPGGKDVNQLAQRGLLPTNISVNHNEMEELVFGSKYEPEPLQNIPSIRVEGLRNASRTPRYFMMVSALDYEAWAKNRKLVVLWTARISTEMWGRNLTDVLPTLIAAGAPMFGRDTDGPRLGFQTLIPEGQVILGTPVMKEEGKGKSPPPPAPSR